jgi:hypothetical protein
MVLILNIDERMLIFEKQTFLGLKIVTNYSILLKILRGYVLGYSPKAHNFRPN